MFLSHYSKPQRIIHWIMAVLIIGLLAMGVYMTNATFATDADKYAVYNLHKSFGVIALGLIFLRIFVRWKKGVPTPHAPTVKQQKLAHQGHNLLYVFMIVLPVSGYIMSMMGGYGIKFFGYPLPNFLGVNKGTAGIAHEIHEIAGLVMIGVVLGHIGFGLWHAFQEKRAAK